MKLEIKVNKEDLSCICPDCNITLLEPDKLVYCSGCCTELPEIADMLSGDGSDRLAFHLKK